MSVPWLGAGWEALSCHCPAVAGGPGTLFSYSDPQLNSTRHWSNFLETGGGVVLQIKILNFQSHSVKVSIKVLQHSVVFRH